MQRLTARLLLLFAIAGPFLPVALQAMAVPMRACCRRAAHHCHDSSALNPEESGVRDVGCCNRERGRAITTAHSASLQPRAAAKSAPEVQGSIASQQTSLHLVVFYASRSTRAPPSC